MIKKLKVPINSFWESSLLIAELAQKYINKIKKFKKIFVELISISNFLYDLIKNKNEKRFAKLFVIKIK